MKYLLITAPLFLFMAKVFAQEVVYPDKNDSSIVKIKGYYNKLGKINSNKKYYLFPPDADSIFIPTSQELLLAERLMTEKYDEFLKSDARAKGLTGTEYKQHYYSYYRQYTGFTSKSGDKIIFTQLFKCCKKNINKCFPNWKKELVIPLSEGSCAIAIGFLVNLKRRKISFP